MEASPVSDPLFGLVLVSADAAWTRAIADVLRRRGLERLVLARPSTLAEGIDGKAALFVDGRLHGEAAACVVRAVQAGAAQLRVIILEAEACPCAYGLAQLAHWRDTRLPDDGELARLLQAREALQPQGQSVVLYGALAAHGEAIN
jgi:hypothetical protein